MVFKPRNLLVTGGAGFIGSNFIRYVYNKWESCRIINIDKNDDGYGANYDEKRYTFVKQDLRNLNIVRKVLDEFEIDTVIHFAAITHVDESYVDRIGTIQENIISTTQLLEAAAIHHKKVERFVHISTDEVYGDSFNDSERKRERSSLKPTNPYAASKASCELILHAYSLSYQLPFIMVRMNNVFGARQHLSKMIPKFINRAIKNEEYPLMGDGKHCRSWMYIDDCCEGLRLVTESGRLGETYNLGTDFEISNYELTRKIHRAVSELLNREMTEPVMCYTPDRPYHDRRYLVNFAKIRNELNWHCTTKFRDGLYSTIKYYIEFSRKKEGIGQRQQG